MSRIWPWLLPDLLAFDPADRGAALRRARDTAPDLIELLGMAAALVLVTVLTRRWLPAPEPGTTALAMLLNFAMAVPLLAVALAPFQWRRLRRGLRALRAKGGTP